ncbi:COG4223 family protein [Salipiger sp. CCB-MM3]|uniref:COG4223 family protein n=1 Tax=Salipiger sp. CCB-MM3 TaxID=1792508 RepID=UPI000826FE92|nr:flagellar FliJ family protein [Salipiger sp. CCB-MM3]
MADEKKPKTGVDENTERDEGLTPETEPTQSEISEGETSEESVTASTGDDTLAAEVQNAATNDTEDADADDSLAGADTERAEGDDTLSEADTVGEGDPLSGDDTLAVSNEDDTVAHEPANSMESIHSVGEAVELDADEDTPAQAEDTLGSAGADTVVVEEERIDPASDPMAREPVSPEPAATVPPQVIQEKVIERKGGFVPMVVGGIIAAALGWGASAYQSGTFPFGDASGAFEEETRAALADQSQQIDALGATLEDTASQVGGIDLTDLENSAVDLGQRMANAEGSAASLSEQVAQLQTRIEDMQNQWLSESVSPEAMAAYEKALADVRTAIETQRAEVEQMTQEAMQAREAASDQALTAESRSALADIETALRDGAPYAEALATLQENGVDVPEGLSAPAGDGVPTLSALEADFPPAARDALSAARRAEATNEDTTSRVATFFANQLGARSVEPRAGDDPDAVLSRAEAALRSGDLGAVLSEVAALPEPAQQELSDWVASAEKRKAALDGADAVAQTLNQN